MKKQLLSIIVTPLLLLSSTSVVAQIWDGSGIRTTTSPAGGAPTPMVGIGTNTPAHELDVVHEFGYPNINMFSAVNITENFWNQSNMVSHIIPGHRIFEINSKYIYDTYPVPSLPPMWPPIDMALFNVGFSDEGNVVVGVNTANPMHTLDVAGDANVAWSVTTPTLNVGNINCSNQVIIGSVGTPGGYKLYVEDGILTEKVKVAVHGTSDWSDFVFDDDYRLTPIEELAGFIKENKHLPDVPSATEVVENGIDLAKMDATLLQKIEELTLYVIQLQKENTTMKNEITNLKTKLDK